ncbi:MAG: hypothetical protein V7785_10160 [Bermanella sp.]
MLLTSIKRFFTLLLLLSLFGQAVAGGVMSCKMGPDDKMQDHTSCMQAMDEQQKDQMQSMEHDTSDAQAECDQSCSCCLGACSASAALPSNLLSLNQASLIRTGYKNLALINRTESLYRPPIAC